MLNEKEVSILKSVKGKLEVVLVNNNTSNSLLKFLTIKTNWLNDLVGKDNWFLRQLQTTLPIDELKNSLSNRRNPILVFDEENNPHLVETTKYWETNLLSENEILEKIDVGLTSRVKLKTRQEQMVIGLKEKFSRTHDFSFLDEGMEDIIKRFNNIPGLATTWCCSGHAKRRVLPDGSLDIVKCNPKGTNIIFVTNNEDHPIFKLLEDINLSLAFSDVGLSIELSDAYLKSSTFKNRGIDIDIISEDNKTLNTVYRSHVLSMKPNKSGWYDLELYHSRWNFFFNLIAEKLGA